MMSWNKKADVHTNIVMEEYQNVHPLRQRLRVSPEDGRLRAGEIGSGSRAENLSPPPKQINKVVLLWYKEVKKVRS